MASVGNSCLDTGTNYGWNDRTRFIPNNKVDVSGVLRSWCCRTGGGGDMKLKIFRIASSTSIVFVGESGWKTCVSGINTFLNDINIPVQPGDILGTYMPYAPYAVIQMNPPVGDLWSFYYADITTDTLASAWQVDSGIYYSYPTYRAYSTTGPDIYVNISAPGDTSGGTSWSSAVKTMRIGYDLLDAGGTIHVATGDYSGQSGITYNKSWSLSPEDPSSSGKKHVSIPPSI